MGGVSYHNINYRTNALIICCRLVVSSWWGVWEACSAVGVSVAKILSLDIRVCTARGE